MLVDVWSPEWTIDRDGAKVSFRVSSANEARAICDEFSDGKTVEMDVHVKKEHRSSSANALLWAALGDIVKVLRKNDPKITADLLYKRYIHESGNYKTADVWASEFQALERIWSSHGIGWFVDIADVIDDVEIDRKLTVRLYYGSSQYDKEEFSRLVDSVLMDARELGIEYTSDAMRSLMKQYPGGQ